MRVTYNNYPIYNTNGSVAGVLDGEYEATPLPGGGQPGWHALRKVLANGTVDPVIAANAHIVTGVTT